MKKAKKHKYDSRKDLKILIYLAAHDIYEVLAKLEKLAIPELAPLLKRRRTRKK
jgi:hypothetical protein